jgi:hypothetical protein
MANTLPTGFEALEPFVERFAASTTAERAARRSASTDEERQSFFQAAKDLVPAALDYLDTKPLDQFDESEQRLMNLALGFAHVALAVEVQGPDETRHAELRQHMRITRSPADAQA